jgi:hypothetical protein
MLHLFRGFWTGGNMKGHTIRAFKLFKLLVVFVVWPSAVHCGPNNQATWPKNRPKPTESTGPSEFPGAFAKRAPTPALNVRPGAVISRAFTTPTPQFPDKPKAQPITVLSPAPTMTPTGLPSIQVGCHVPFASVQQLRSSIQTLKAEKIFSVCLNGKIIGSERWQILYREPSDALLKVYDTHGNLERTKFFHGVETSCKAAGIHQEIIESEPQAWSRVIQFFDLKVSSAEIKESRRLVPGLWVPNTSESPMQGMHQKGGTPLLRRSILSLELNGNVDRDFSAGGR